MRIAIAGGAGQLASDLAPELGRRGHVVRCFVRAEWDVTDEEGTRRALDAFAPDVVINTAAYHRVDEIEDQPARAFAVNATAVLSLARATRARGAQFIHFSTDYVFDGEAGRPYTENDRPRPLNVYGASKLAGEHLAMQAHPDALIVRTSGLFGGRGTSSKGGNFVSTMLRLAREGRTIRVVNDQTLSPTYTAHLARFVADLLETRAAGGLYHGTAAGHVSFFDFAAAIFTLAGLRPDLQAQTTAESGSRARRPRFSALVSARRPATLAPLPPWSEGLREYLEAQRAPEL